MTNGRSRRHDYPQPYSGLYRGYLKRQIDIAGALIGISLCVPIVCAIAVGVWLSMGKPILFRQVRSGRHRSRFEIIKFRTMTEDVSASLDDQARLTPVGAWLRSYSLDELPELWNVLRGDMSLVGPRPLLIQYLDRYTAEQARRLDIRPGITGWAQINGRNVLSWEEKFKYDVWYVDHCSFWLDVRILAATVWKTLRREGISAPGHVTAHEFMGSAEP